MKQYLVKWLSTSLAVFLVPQFVSGIEIKNYGTALVLALVLGLLNTVLRPLLFFITLPINILSLGVFTLVLNAFLFQLAAKFVEGVYLSNFGAAFWASLCISILSWILQMVFGGSSGRTRVHFQTYTQGGRRVRDLNS